MKPKHQMKLKDQLVLLPAVIVAFGAVDGTNIVEGLTRSRLSVRA
jgi:hypothetical protein